MYRTLNPYGHVSKANRLNRLETQRQIWAHGQILQKVPEGQSLFDELLVIHNKAKKDMSSLSQEEKKRYNEICDLFVISGIREDIIELALG